MGLLCLTSCELGDYSEPSETFTGKFVDKTTGEGVQTEIGDNGIQLYMHPVQGILQSKAPEP